MTLQSACPVILDLTYSIRFAFEQPTFQHYFSLFVDVAPAVSYCVICAALHRVISSNSSWSICSRKATAWGYFVCQRWLPPSGNRGVKKMASVRGSKSIRACWTGRWYILSGSGAEVYKNSNKLQHAGVNGGRTAGGNAFLELNKYLLSATNWNFKFIHWIPETAK